MSRNRTASLLSLAAVALFGFAFLSPAPAQSQEIGAGKDIGVGLGWGTFAAGLTGKYYMGPNSALQGHLGSTYVIGYHDRGYHGYHDHDHGRFRDRGIGLSIDYVWEPAPIATAPAGRLFGGIGGGGAIFNIPYESHSHGGLAVNGVAEIGWQFSPVPIEVVLDYRPYIAFAEGGAWGDFLLPLGFSARVYF